MFADHRGGIHRRILRYPFLAHLSTRECGFCPGIARLPRCRSQLPAWMLDLAKHALPTSISYPCTLRQQPHSQCRMAKLHQLMLFNLTTVEQVGSFASRIFRSALADWVDPRVGLQESDQSHKETGQQPIFDRFLMAQRLARIARAASISKLDRREWVGGNRPSQAQPRCGIQGRRSSQ